MIWDNIVCFFKKILELIDNYGLEKILQALIVCGIVLLGMSTLNKCQTPDIIKQYIANQYTTHETQNEKRAKIDPYVREYLLKLLNEINCDRTYILEMHNGVSNPSGLPFRYCEMTYEELNKNTEEVSDQYDKVNMSKYPIFTYLNERGLFIGSIDELGKIDSKISCRMKMNGTKYMAFKIINGHQTPLAILGISFCNDSIKTEHEKLEIISAMANYGDKISLMLDMNKEE